MGYIGRDDPSRHTDYLHVACGGAASSSKALDQIEVEKTSTIISTSVPKAEGKSDFAYGKPLEVLSQVRDIKA